MNAPLPVRTKLNAALVSILVIYGLCCYDIYYKGPGRDGTFYMLMNWLWVLTFPFFAVWSVFCRANFQLLAGQVLACVALFTTVILILVPIIGRKPFKDAELPCILAATAAAYVGAYLLLLDKDVKDYRRSIQLKKAT